MGLNEHDLSATENEMLEQALERITAGSPLAVVLADFKDDALWLEPLLAQALAVKALRLTVSIPRPEPALSQFLSAAEAMAPSRPIGWRRVLRIPIFHPLTASLTGFLVLMTLLFSSALILSAESDRSVNVLPTHPLYILQRFGEEVYLRLPQSSARHDSLADLYARRRQYEVRKLLAQNQPARVSFPGIVENVRTDQVVVSGLVCVLSAGHDAALPFTADVAQIEGTLTVGAHVVVEGHIETEGWLVAERIVVTSASN